MVVIGSGSRMLMAVAVATLLALPNLLADEPSRSNEGQDGGVWAWRASKMYWELHGLAGRDPGKTGDDWSLPPWFVDVSQDDYLTECSDIRSNLKVPRPDLCCLSSCAKIVLCLFSGTDGIHAGTHRGKGQQSLHPHNLSTECLRGGTQVPGNVANLSSNTCSCRKFLSTRSSSRPRWLLSLA